jgi:uncharacterized membrane protein (UPF0127 family)
MRLRLVGILLVVFVAGILLIIISNTSTSHTNAYNFLASISAPPGRILKAEVIVNNFTLKADLALTQEQQTKGLAVKNTMNETQGMLFVFQHPALQSFWMKDMKFPIDIIWMDANRSVVYIAPNLQPCPAVGDCPGYVPTKESMYVLETTAGFSHRHHVIPGTQMNFRLLG